MGQGYYTAYLPLEPSFTAVWMLLSGDSEQKSRIEPLISNQLIGAFGDKKTSGHVSKGIVPCLRRAHVSKDLYQAFYLMTSNHYRIVWNFVNTAPCTVGYTSSMVRFYVRTISINEGEIDLGSCTHKPIVPISCNVPMDEQTKVSVCLVVIRNSMATVLDTSTSGSIDVFPRPRKC
jgi:hypothetical protein